MTNFFQKAIRSRLLLSGVKLLPMLCLFFGTGVLQAQVGCDPDVTAPVCVAPADVTVSCENFDPSLLNYGVATATDNCCMQSVGVLSVNKAQFDTLCNKGTITRFFKAQDCTGNSSQCTQRIVVNYNQHYYVRFPDDVITTVPSPTGFYGEPTFYSEDCELTGVSYGDQVFTLLGGTLRIERTWTVINWCTYDPLLPGVTVPNPEPNTLFNHPANLLGPTVAPSGTAAPWAPTQVALTPGGNVVDFSTFWSAGVNAYRYIQNIYIADLAYMTIQGSLFVDADADCLQDNGEMGLAGHTVYARGDQTGFNYQGITDANGNYVLQAFSLDQTVTLSSDILASVSPNCQNTFSFPVNPNTTVIQDLPVNLNTNCNELSVDMSAPILRRCFTSNYHVNACNQSAQEVEDVYTIVTFDNYLSVQSASLPYTALGNNQYRVDIGDMNPGDCERISFTILVSCEVPLGYVHCSEAQIFPTDECGYSGPVLIVNNTCNTDSVRFEIKNVGNAAMSTPVEFVVVEDVIMYTGGQASLDIDASKSIAVPSNGSTWLLRVAQAPEHPWQGVVSSIVRGCGGNDNSTAPLQFGLSSSNPFETTDCQANVGSYDPNDKAAVPAGYGAQHLLEANTDIDYKIRFQNTGTDTAFTVVILDTLSSHLNPLSVRPGASSHTYTYELLDGNVLRFRFDNIMLPDSNVNEPGSNGFVKFKVSQMPDLANGTRIENDAAIFFDFNDPVITNTTFHEIGDHFIVSAVVDPGQTIVQRVFPNPAQTSATFELDQALQDGRFLLYDALGRVVRSQNVQGTQYRFERGDLPAGAYQYRIQEGAATLATGTLLIK
ncbi:MAG: T9SS type A sorting domain-containing protein [Chitinophagales bacterium]|nr:T9SS type A sorting domain-containing protein [Chitinophagales bacterium]